ncbi:jg11448 [Pararge aegeria aegeria]|uniref:Jg11448 protein n=1 Tax=Pararge aegeria aegeria TaxID=348720 RepID=A0A8S4RVV0_9NEOP|nr:jg11448 [Pararge aegeria aegeria]
MGGVHQSALGQRGGVRPSHCGRKPLTVVLLSRNKQKIGFKKEKFRSHFVLKRCQFRVLIRSFNKRAASEALALNRKNLCILVRALTGHCGLNRHMFNLKLQDTDLCRLCKEAAETPLHLICSCFALMHKRSTLLGKHIMQPEDAKFLPARKVLLVLKATNACWEI